MISHSIALAFFIATFFFSYNVALKQQRPWKCQKIQSLKSLRILSTVHDDPKSDLLDIFDGKSSKDHDIYACPETLDPLSKITRFYGFYKDSYFYNTAYDIKYKIKNGYYDLRTKSEMKKTLMQQSTREFVNTNFFKIPFISAIYERGYRQNFERSGFPGIEKEFSEVKELFRASNASVVLDLSCGSGFMTRNLIKSKEFSRVIAADLSPTMLAETKRRIKEENLRLPELVRCDSARLPFKSNSLDAIHAGAAIHCWPQLNTSLSEVFRVLKPGGVVYASTFLNLLSMASGRKITNDNAPFNEFTSIEELKTMFENAGFNVMRGQVNVRKEGSGCAIIKAIKLDDKDSFRGASEELLKMFPDVKISLEAILV